MLQIDAGTLSRNAIFPEAGLPDFAALRAEAKGRARQLKLTDCPFLTANKISSEADYKRLCMQNGRIMRHAQVGFRDPGKTSRAISTIYDQLTDAGYGVDRFGICLDWSMGYPKAERPGRPKGTGLILDDAGGFGDIAHASAAASHFGDFVIGMPSALENTIAALEAGSTSVGNLGQYFTFRLPDWNDDITTTAETIKAIILAGFVERDVLIHSNLDDGFAAQFGDLASALGAVLIEKEIIETLLEGQVSHCFGHTFTGSLSRLAFHRALSQVSNTPGTMIYGNTTAYGPVISENYAALAAYLSIDIAALSDKPTGHAINPVPVTEAKRIPDVDEIVDAHLFAGKLVERLEGFPALIDFAPADALAFQLVEAGRTFKERVFKGLAAAGVDVSNAFELLLAIRRIGAKRLEFLFGPGARETGQPNGRRPVWASCVIDEIASDAKRRLAKLDESDAERIKTAGLSAIVATTDVHEYGKRLLEAVLVELDVEIINGGVSTDPSELAELASDSHADFVALSTYNGIALGFFQRLCSEMTSDIPVFIGGKLNQIPDGTNTDLPVDVSNELSQAGAFICREVESLFEPLTRMAQEKSSEGSGE
jgi:methylmalonyl-CoA mutase cobalamin-binding subunit